MIQDIERIHAELDGYQEVLLPYEFTKGTRIKYLTLKADGSESFYPGGGFQGIGHNCLFLKNTYKQWSVPIRHFTKEGLTRFATRFFVPREPRATNESNESNEINDESQTIRYQQDIIDKLVSRLQTMEQDRLALQGVHSNYEDLLSQGRSKLQEMIQTIRDQDHQLQELRGTIG